MGRDIREYFCRNSDSFYFVLFLRYLKQKNPNLLIPVLIIGANRASQNIIKAIKTDIFCPYRVVEVVDPYGLAKTPFPIKILGKLDILESVLQTNKIQSIIQTDAFEHTVNIVSICQEQNIQYQMLPAPRGLAEENLRIRKVQGISVASFVNREKQGLKKSFFAFGDFVLDVVFDVPR